MPNKEKRSKVLTIESEWNNILDMRSYEDIRKEMIRLTPERKHQIIEGFSNAICRATYRRHGLVPPDAKKTGYHIYAWHRFMRIWGRAEGRGRIHKSELDKVGYMIQNTTRWMDGFVEKIDIPGDIIRTYRERLGYSQSGIAQKMAWSRQYQNKLENAKSVKLTSRSLTKLWRHLLERDMLDPPQWTGPELKQMLRCNNVTQAKFAEFAGWSRKYQAKLENTPGLLPYTCQIKIQRLARLILLY